VADWQSTYSERFLQRAIQRPEPDPVYVRVRLTDEQIESFPEHLRSLAYMTRAFGDSMEKTVAAVGQSMARAREERHG